MDYDVETLAYLESESTIAEAIERIDFYVYESGLSIADIEYWIDANRGIVNFANRWAGDSSFSNGLHSRSLELQAFSDRLNHSTLRPF